MNDPYDMLLLPCTEFEADGSPKMNQRARDERCAQRANEFPNSYIVVSGNKRGVQSYLKTDPTATEATQAAKHLQELGISSDRMLLEHNAEESVGNIVLSLLFFGIPRRLKKVLVISQGWHATRLAMWSGHIVPDDIEIGFDSVDCYLPAERRQKIIDKDIYEGVQYFYRFRKEVPHGDLVAAFRWICDNDTNERYVGIRIPLIYKTAV